MIVSVIQLSACRKLVSVILISKEISYTNQLGDMIMNTKSNTMIMNTLNALAAMFNTYSDKGLTANIDNDVLIVHVNIPMVFGMIDYPDNRKPWSISWSINKDYFEPIREIKYDSYDGYDSYTYYSDDDEVAVEILEPEVLKMLTDITMETNTVPYITSDYIDNNVRQCLQIAMQLAFMRSQSDNDVIPITVDFTYGDYIDTDADE